MTERTLARRTDRIVAVGEQVRDDLLAAGVRRPGQYAVISPGVAVRTPPTRDAARRGLDADGAVVSVVGQLTAVKRPDRSAGGRGATA